MFNLMAYGQALAARVRQLLIAAGCAACVLACCACGIGLPPGIIDNGHWVNYWKTASLTPPAFLPDGSLVCGQGRAARCLSPDLQERWKSEVPWFPYHIVTGDDGSSFYSSPLDPPLGPVDSGNPYLWATGGKLHCLGPDGSEAWSVAYSNGLATGLGIAVQACRNRDTLIVRHESATDYFATTFREVDAEGTELWRLEEPTVVQAWLALPEGGVAYTHWRGAPEPDAALVFVSAEGEAQELALAPEDRPNALAAGTESVPVIAVDGPDLHAYTENGIETWAYHEDAPDTSIGELAVTQSGKLAAIIGTQLCWFDAATGELLSESALPAEYSGNLTACGDVVALRWSGQSNPQPTYGAYDSSGVQLWSFQLGQYEHGEMYAPDSSAPAALYMLCDGPSDGKLGSVNSFLLRIDPASGARLGKYQSTDRYEARYWTGPHAD